MERSVCCWLTGRAPPFEKELLVLGGLTSPVRSKQKVGN